MEENGAKRTIHVVGAGGVGFWLATALVQANLPLKVYDTDNLEGGLGFARLPLGTPKTLKTDLLRGFLRVNFAGRMPEFIPKLFTGGEIAKGDLVVDCSDMSGVDRRKVWARASKKGARLLRVSYDGARSTVVIAEGLPITLNEKASGYANVPSLALSLAAGGLGAEVVLRMWAANMATEYTEVQIDVADWVGVKALPEPEQTVIDELAKVGITEVAVSGQ